MFSGCLRNQPGWTVPVAVILLLLIPPALVSASDGIVSEFMCPCPDLCGKALEVCECGDAAGYIREIEEMKSKGMGVQVIREKFVEKYGPTVLASPPAKGFGLLVYVMPPLAVALGCGMVFLLVQKWRRPKDSNVRVSPADIRKAEEELKKWK